MTEDSDADILGDGDDEVGHSDDNSKALEYKTRLGLCSFNSDVCRLKSMDSMEF